VAVFANSDKESLVDSKVLSLDGPVKAANKHKQNQTKPTRKHTNNFLSSCRALQGSHCHLNVCGLEKEETLLVQGKCHAKKPGQEQIQPPKEKPNTTDAPR